MKIIYSFLCVVFLCLGSCTNKEQQTFKLSKTNNRLEIKLEKKTPSVGAMQYIEIEDKGLLTYLNKAKNSIAVFDIKEAKQIDEIVIPKGESGYPKGRMIKFSAINDTLIGIATSQFNFALINWKGKLVKTFDGLVVDNVYTAPSLSPSFRISHEQINYTLRWLTPVNDCSDVTKIALSADISLIDYSTSICKFRVPEEYCSPDIKSYQYTWYRELYDSSYIYSFTFSNYIYQYDKKQENKHTKKPAKSKYAPENLMQKKALTIDEGRKAMYGKIVYDKYRNVFYRFFLLEHIFNEGETIFEAARFKKQFSIIVLDKDLNVIGETLFPENTYISYMHFVAPEGLYISTNHIKNPDFDEDYLKFELFELKEM